MQARHTLVIAVAAFAAACAPAETNTDAEAAAASAPVMQVALADQDLPTILVYKTESCGCCKDWVEHLRAAGFTVDARDVQNIASVKVDAGVPGAMSSCHTAIVDGYVVEGHVPADQIRRMLAERPEIAGIAVPGMPAGSPGMESPNAAAYQVMAFDRAGNAKVFAEIDPR